MNDFDERQARREVEHLHQLAMDANDEGHFATMERLLEHAVSVAQRLGDLPLQIQERYWLATAQRMQGKDRQAVGTYSWLLGLATDPTHAQHLTNPETLRYLAGAFMNFVECGRFLPAMPVAHLLQVLFDGMYWLEGVGKAHWAAGLRYVKGRLLKHQGNLPAARVELEAALSLKRRHPDAPGYTLAAYQLDLADLLRDEGIKAYAQAISLAEEVLAATASSPYARWWAYKTLAYTHLEMGEHEAALGAAQQSLALAQAMESASAVTVAYELLGRLYREAGRLDEAAHATAQAWRWARRHGSVEYRNTALTNCARVRNLQARAACGLPATWDALPQQVPTQATRSLALRHVQSVRRLVRWATPLATQLDRATGRRAFQEDMDGQLQRAEEVERWLRQGGEHEG